MRRRAIFFLIAVSAVMSMFVASCDTSDERDRLAAQRLFRNYLIQQDSSAAANVRIQDFICLETEELSRLCDANIALPPDFPLLDGLTLLGSAFTDTELARELIVGWEIRSNADTLLAFYGRELDQDPWRIELNKRVSGIDFLQFIDIDDTTFEGEVRIAQEGNDAVLILIARNTITLTDGSSS